MKTKNPETHIRFTGPFGCAFDPDKTWFDLAIRGVVLLATEVASVLTLFYCHRFFNSQKDEHTEKIWKEIKFYPIIFIFLNGPSVLVTLLQIFGARDVSKLEVLEEFVLGFQGALICAIFFWKKNRQALFELWKRQIKEPKVTDGQLQNLKIVF